jgi:hypothetical protein
MRISKIAAIGVLAVGASVAVAPKAQAAFIATIEQVGANVVVTGSGTFDLAGLTLASGAESSAGIFAPEGVFVIGSSNPESTDLYTGFSGPASFGSGAANSPSDGSGDKAGLLGSLDALLVPNGYVSGSALSDISTYDNATFASLGVTPGTYTWTWGTGGDADSFTLNIGAPDPTPTPEPASLALLGTGLAALGLNRRRRRKGA